jgi:hypothetical protein
MFYADPWDEVPRLEQLLESELLHRDRVDGGRRVALSVVDHHHELARQHDVRALWFDRQADGTIVLTDR